MTPVYQVYAATGKKCSRCKIEREWDEFEKDSHSADNYRHICKKCRAFLRGRSDVDPAVLSGMVENAPQEATGGQLTSVRTAQGVVGLHGMRLTRTSATLPQNITFEQFQDCIAESEVWEGSVRWWIGDMLRQGEMRFSDEYAQSYGDGTTRYQMYANCKWVANRFAEVSRRRENLSWSHHETVAGLEPSEADAYLAEAESEGWSVAKLRAVKKEREQAIEQTPSSLTVVENAPDAANNIRQAQSEPAPSAALQSFFAEDEISSGSQLAREPQEQGDFTAEDLISAGFEEMQERIGIWAERTFPQSTSLTIHRHLRKELGELTEVVDAYMENGMEAATWLTTREEFADVFMLMASLAHRQGWSLFNAIDAKFREVQTREYSKPDEHGVVEHIRTEQICPISGLPERIFSRENEVAE